MPISAVTYDPGNQIVNGAKSSSSSGLTGMDGDAFMMILLAQLRNQNPLEPMDDKELIGQMTQLNSLEELKKINTTLNSLTNLLEPK